MFVGAGVQGSLGFGMGLVSIPVLGLMVPERLPQTVVLVVMPLVAFMLWQERSAIRPGMVSWLLAGRVLGVLPAVGVLAVTSERVLQMVIALATLLTVAMMGTHRLRLEVTPRNQLAVGTISGFIGTSAGFGGPPVALLYAEQTGRTLRATLALVMLVGNTVSLVGYWSADRLAAVDVALAMVLLGPTLLGLATGVLVRRRLAGPLLRTAVLSVVAVTALALLARAVLG